ncbi:methionine import ATP-binding protein MetN 1 [Enterococcus faecalis]|nr:methionine import ATP-binding protein MetN 1 [Enterococcus faecalis]
MIELKNISVTFQQKKQEIQAVQDVSLTIDKGDISTELLVIPVLEKVR